MGDILLKHARVVLRVVVIIGVMENANGDIINVKKNPFILAIVNQMIQIVGIYV